MLKQVKDQWSRRNQVKEKMFTYDIEMIKVHCRFAEKWILYVTGRDIATGGIWESDPPPPRQG